MDFYVVFCKNRKKFDKYVKVNRIKNKVIIDIQDQLEDIQVKDRDKHRDYFNLLIYTKIIQSIKKNKDIYYLPNFHDKTLEINDIIKLKKYISNNSNFNILMFFDDFNQEDLVFKDVFNYLDIFESSQIIKDY